MFNLGVKASIEADVAILRFISWLIELIPGTENSFSLSDCVEEFSSLMMRQLDMKLEAENLERFRRNFHLSDDSSASNQISSITSFFSAFTSWEITGLSKGKVTFPYPVRPYVSDSVLVETFESGRQISGILDEMVNKKLRREIATAGLDAILQMVFKDNFIHAGNSPVRILSPVLVCRSTVLNILSSTTLCFYIFIDLHPGNVLFRELDHGNLGLSSSSSLPSLLLRTESAQGSPNQWELSFIDAGLVSTLDKEDRRNFIDLFAAVVQNDGKRVGELMVDRSRGGGAKCINREKFVAEIGELVTSVHSSGAANRYLEDFR